MMMGTFKRETLIDYLHNFFTLQNDQSPLDNDPLIFFFIFLKYMFVHKLCTAKQKCRKHSMCFNHQIITGKKKSIQLEIMSSLNL